jgi:hypothetical protein
MIVNEWLMSNLISLKKDLCVLNVKIDINYWL